MAGMPRRDKLLRIVVGLVLALYVASYVWLSRRGYSEADQFRAKGFYYLSPEDSQAWRLKNYGCVALFGPLNAIDRALGWGRGPASEPLWGLSRKRN
jgi:hypothetical protein